MSTLTGDDPRLDGHCPHKLPTSCRLTSTLLCCACEDKRPHSATYAVYVDGVGFVPRGTRWQGYCWYCQTFWNHRVEAANPPVLRTQCRIPEVPEQTQFLEAWFEFHQGYKNAIGENGQAERVELQFEPWVDVPPGYLPRLLSELEAGQQQNRGVFISETNPTDDDATTDGVVQTIEDAIEDLLNELSDDEQDEGSAAHPSRDLQTAPPIRDETRARRRSRREGVAERMTRIFGTREEIASDDYQSPIGGMFTRAWRRYQAVQTATHSLQDDPRTPIETLSEEELHEFIESLRQRDEAISLMLSNLTELSWDFEQLHRMLNGPQGSGSFTRWRQNLFELEQELNGQRRGVHDEMTRAGVSPPTIRITTGYRALSQAFMVSDDVDVPQDAGDQTAPPPPRVNQVLRGDATHQVAAVAAAARQVANIVVHNWEDTPPKGLDNDESRPPPKEDNDLNVNVACQICYTQLADQAVLPCGHMCMCKYCAEIAMPTLRHARTSPQGDAKCPVCRRKATSRVRICY